MINIRSFVDIDRR